MSTHTYLKDFDEYQRLYEESTKSPETFWARTARSLLAFDKDFQTTYTGCMEQGKNAWFPDGLLNACYNCVDRHALRHPNKPAIIYEADEPNNSGTVTYGDLLRDVSQLAWVLRQHGLQKGDTVTIYMPNCPQVIVAMLACARLGAIHSVVFSGFSSASLAERIQDAGSNVVLTTDYGQRGGKRINAKSIVDHALQECPFVRAVIAFRRTDTAVDWVRGRDFWWHEEIEKAPIYLAPEAMGAEDPLFLLYTSGSTGKPKGILHTTAGYLVGAAASGKYTFNIHNHDRMFCSADVGWITGHTYTVYAPLLLGCATTVFEGTPTYPTPSRYWDIIEKHGITHFCAAPTALRVLKNAGNDCMDGYEMKDLRVLCTAGEPIAPEVWDWYSGAVGKGEGCVLDTYWQTETGSHLVAPLAGITPTKPGSVSLPFFGIKPAILDPGSGKEVTEHDVEGALVIKQPWPSMARTIWGAHELYMDTYFSRYPGYYFTGDLASRDQDGFYWIKGRADDIVNVSGHRISTAEIEAVILDHEQAIETAVVGVPDKVTGHSLNAFVSAKSDPRTDESTHDEVRKGVRTAIGTFAAPKSVFLVNDLPKTRSGKIMRRILRRIAGGDQDLGDLSTLMNPDSVAEVADRVRNG
ncbi:acetyl-coenzyme A synthetase [Aspergillus terreus]|nr:acetyl-coenzyme A synthetase [Aspergillus terreus]